jgi:hypothetical protein
MGPSVALIVQADASTQNSNDEIPMTKQKEEAPDVHLMYIRGSHCVSVIRNLVFVIGLSFEFRDSNFFAVLAKLDPILPRGTISS